MKLARVTYLLIFTLIAVYAKGQAYFQETFGGFGTDDAQAVCTTADQGIIIVGSTASFGEGGNDIFLIKTNLKGDILWTKAIGGPQNEYGYDVVASPDGGFVIAGSTNSYGAGNYDMLLIKCDEQGNLEWSKTFGGNNIDRGHSVCCTADSGYAIAGFTISYGAGSWDVYLIKTDSEGNLLWSKTFGGNSFDYGYNVESTPDNGFIIAGETWSIGSGNNDALLIRTDSVGSLVWANSYGGSGFDAAKCAIPTTDGGFAMAAETWSFGAGIYDMYLVKTDASGTLEFSKALGANLDEKSMALVQHGTDLILCGSTSSYGQGEDGLLTRFDSSGNLKLSVRFGGSGNERLNAISPTADRGFILVGQTSGFGASSPGVYIAKTDSSLSSLCNETNINPSLVSANTIQNSGLSQNSGISVNNFIPSITPASLSDSTLCYQCDSITASFNYSDSLLTVSFTNTSVSRISSLWNFGDGDTSSDDNPTHTYSNPGTYWSCLQVDNGCDIDFICDSIYVSEPASIGQIANGNKQIIIYPNPTTGVFIVQGATGEIQIYDLFGHTVLSATKPEIDMRGYANGVYFVRVGEVVGKVVLH